MMTPGPAAADGGCEEVLLFRAPKAAILLFFCIAAYRAILISTARLPRVSPAVIIGSPPQFCGAGTFGVQSNATFNISMLSW